jgi:energy-coupling factor transport system substrate-specific component
MQRSSSILFVTVGIAAILLIITSLTMAKSYLLVGMMMILLAMIPFFIRFERRHIQSRELVLIALLAAFAAVSRVPFAALPSVQPTSFVIIMCAVVFGGETGFLIGSLAALVSNMFLGQGPWTPWQMFGWGMMGLTAGLLKDTWLMQHKAGRIIYGFAAGILFGWLMNSWFLLSYGESITWQAVAAAYAASLYFDLAHALSNVFFLMLFSASWLKILQRYKKKYGILT